MLELFSNLHLHQVNLNIYEAFDVSIYVFVYFKYYQIRILPSKLTSICFVELDTPGFTSYKEKFTKIDHEKRLKETEVVEGGLLDYGFTLYLVRFEIIEKGADSCIIKTTVEYDVKEEAAANASIVTIEPLAKIVEMTKNYLIKSKV